MPSSLGWNLLLATIPVLLAHAIPFAARRRGALWPGATWLLGALWLSWLPNTIYLLTEWRHWLEIVDNGQWATRAYDEPGLYFTICVWGAFFFLYALYGVFALTGAVRPVEALLRERGWKPYQWAPPLFFAVAIGVYLGLILRFNSWDFVTRPGAIAGATANIFRRPVLLGSIGAFTLIQWALYEAVDLWWEALKERWQQKVKRENARRAR